MAEVIGFAGIWSQIKVLDKYIFLPDGSARWNINGITIHPKGNKNVCSKVNGNHPVVAETLCSKPTVICQAHGVTRWKVKGPPKPLGLILWGPRMSVQHLLTIHPLVVELFQPGSKWWPYRMTNVATLCLHKTQRTTVNVPDVNDSRIDLTAHQNVSLLFLQIWKDCVNKGHPGQEHQSMQRWVRFHWLCPVWLAVALQSCSHFTNPNFDTRF